MTLLWASTDLTGSYNYTMLGVGVALFLFLLSCSHGQDLASYEKSKVTNHTAIVCENVSHDAVS